MPIRDYIIFGIIYFLYLCILTEQKPQLQQSGIVTIEEIVGSNNTAYECDIPTIYPPDGGTFAGSVEVQIRSSTLDAVLHYMMKNTADQSIIQGTSKNDDVLKILKSCNFNVYASKVGFADSKSISANFTILPKVETPVITPEVNTFTISATFYINCATSGATIYYTTDGSTPTLSSLKVSDNGAIVIDETGRFTVKAYASKNEMISSDVVTKHITILQRSPAPDFSPPSMSSDFMGDLDLYFKCNATGKVYYTIDSTSTPTISSLSVACGYSVKLSAPGIFTVRAFASQPGKSDSSIVQAIYSLARPSYDEHDANSQYPYQIQPDVQAFVVEKELPTTHMYGDARFVRGRLVVLSNPIGHFDVIQPLGGCGKLSLPSSTGRNYTVPGGWNLERNTSSVERFRYSIAKSMFGTNIDEAKHKVWMEEYNAVKDLGCQVVTNAGFFNITSNQCFGNVVEEGKIVRSSTNHNVNFGIRNGKFFVGYVDVNNVDVSQFDTLVSGLVWIVRNGKTYVSESLVGDKEDMRHQSTGTSFASVLSARTCIGYNSDGHLMILQVEGETWVRGMTLYEFSNFAIDLGFIAAVNLDGGGSATMTINHTLVSEPSWKCLGPSNPKGYYHCEKNVSTVTCIHAMRPPIFKSIIDKSSSPVPTNMPSSFPSEKRTSTPTYTWAKSDDDFSKDDFDTMTDDVNASGTGTNTTTLSLTEMAKDLEMYKVSTIVLAALLSFSVLVHMWAYSKGKSGGSLNTLSYPKQSGGIPVSTVMKSMNISGITPSMHETKQTKMIPLQPSGDWQNKLKSMNFDNDSDDDSSSYAQQLKSTKHSSSTKSKKNCKKSSSNSLSSNLSASIGILNSKNPLTASAGREGNRASSTKYSIIVDSSDEEDDDNPFDK